MSTAIRDAMALKRINTMRARCALQLARQAAESIDPDCKCMHCELRRRGPANLKELFAAIGDDMSDGEIQAIVRGPGVH